MLSIDKKEKDWLIVHECIYFKHSKFTLFSVTSIP